VINGMNMKGGFAAALLVLLQLFLTAKPAEAGGGPQNLAVIVNPNDPDSLAVANAYIEVRRIPASNVFYIRWNAEAPRTSGGRSGPGAHPRHSGRRRSVPSSARA